MVVPSTLHPLGQSAHPFVNRNFNLKSHPSVGRVITAIRPDHGIIGMYTNQCVTGNTAASILDDLRVTGFSFVVVDPAGPMDAFLPAEGHHVLGYLAAIMV